MLREKPLDSLTILSVILARYAVAIFKAALHHILCASITMY